MEDYSDYSAVCTTEELQSIPGRVLYNDQSVPVPNATSYPIGIRGFYPGVIKATEASSSLLAFVQ